MEYVTGFGKRKQQRRKKAAKELQEKVRRDKIEERKERRKDMYGGNIVGKSESQEAEANREEVGMTILFVSYKLFPLRFHN